MKRIRNPRYAPEFLERKLSPSGLAGDLGVSALYSTPVPTRAQDPTTSPDLTSDLDPAWTYVSHVDPTMNYAFSNDPLFDDATDDPFEDPFVDDDPYVTDDPIEDDPPFFELLPDEDPQEPEPPDLDDGQPPFVPIPPSPIGPAGPG